MQVDPKELLDKTTSSPKPSTWLAWLAGITILGVGLVYFYPRLFPEAEANLRPVQLSLVPPQSTTTSVTETTKNLPSPALELNTINDTVSGVSYGLPADWVSFTDSGVIRIQPDSCGTSSVMIYPVKLIDLNLTATSLLESWISVSKTVATEQNSSLSPGEITSDTAQDAQTIFSGTICGNPIRGTVSATISADRGVIKMSWAPETIAQDLENTLLAVAKSYKLTGAANQLKYSGQRLALAAPESWDVVEQDQSISVISAASRVLATILPLSSTDSPASAINTIIQLQRDAGVEITNEQTLQAVEKEVTDGNDRVWRIASRMIVFTAGNTSKQAVITSGYTPDLDATLVAWRESSLDSFDTQSALLLAIERSTKLLAGSGLISTDSGPFMLPYHHLTNESAIFGGDLFRETLNAASRDRWEDIILGYQKTTDESNTSDLVPISSR